MADFLYDYVLPTGWIILMILAIVLPLLVAVAYLTLAERKVLALMQLRKGPQRRRLVRGCCSRWPTGSSC